MSSQTNLTIHPSLPLIFTQVGQTALEKKAETENLDADAAWHFYSHSIRRNPNDLNLHTHRVFFAMRHKDANFLAGSLHDLFYVLKDSGEKLRIRLLKASLPHLSKKDTLYFAMWIKSSTKKGMCYRWVKGSVLSDGLYGPDHDLITLHKNTVDESVLSPLEEARSCMEYGQLDIARKILEKGLDEDAENKGLMEELAYLNQYAKSREIEPPKAEVSSFLGRLKNKVFS